MATTSEFTDSVLKHTACLREAISTIDHSKHKIALVTDEANRLVGTVTDGDVRRALLAGNGMDTPVTEFMYRRPVTMPASGSREESERTARRREIHKIPVVDDSGRLVGLHIVEGRKTGIDADNWVVLMAGGLGKRLHPLTENAPKPLLAVGERPLLETIVDRLVEQGFRKIYFSVRYKAEMVKAHFGNGESWAADFRYLHEPEPLGTGGALGLLPERPTHPFVVMNADLLTKINLDQFLEFHGESGSMATMAVRDYEFEIPYGVVTTDGDRISAIEEKPVQQIFVNAGIYAFDPAALDHVEPGQRLDMPDLFTRLIAADKKTSAFPIREYWIDVGRMEDYHRANDEFEGEFG